MKRRGSLRPKFMEKLASNRVAVLGVSASKHRPNLVGHSTGNTCDGRHHQHFLCSRECDVVNAPLLLKLSSSFGWRKVIVHKRNQAVNAADNDGDSAGQALRFVKAHYPHEITFGPRAPPLDTRRLQTSSHNIWSSVTPVVQLKFPLSSGQARNFSEPEKFAASSTTLPPTSSPLERSPTTFSSKTSRCAVPRASRSRNRHLVTKFDTDSGSPSSITWANHLRSHHAGLRLFFHLRSGCSNSIQSPNETCRWKQQFGASICFR